MPTRHNTDQPTSPELDAIATAAADRLHAQAGEDNDALADHSQRVADAASAAIRAGAALSAIADAEREGEQRARNEMRTDILRRVERAAKRKREADTDYEQTIDRAARVGLSHREIAAAAHVTHGTVRAVLTRADTTTAKFRPQNQQRRRHRGRTDSAEPLAA